MSLLIKITGSEYTKIHYTITTIALLVYNGFTKPVQTSPFIGTETYIFVKYNIPQFMQNDRITIDIHMMERNKRVKFRAYGCYNENFLCFGNSSLSSWNEG